MGAVSTEDVVGVHWSNANKGWIPTPVAKWILSEYPDLLPNHGWFTWLNGDIDTKVCVCTRPLPEHDGKHSPLLLHVAEQIARRLMVEELEAEAKEKKWSTFRSATKVSWIDENGVVYSIDDAAVVRMRRIDE